MRALQKIRKFRSAAACHIAVCAALLGCAHEAPLQKDAAGYPFDGGNARTIFNQADGSACRVTGYVTAEPVARQLEIIAEMTGSYSTDDSVGILVVNLAGSLVMARTLTRLSNVLPDGRLVAEKKYWVDANEVLPLMATGEVKDGECRSLKVVVLDSVKK